MKTKTLDWSVGIAFGICVAVLVLLACLSGCSSAAGTIEAATTKVEIRTGKNKGFALQFPKELQATKLDLSIDPQTNVIKLKADELKSSSTAIIESAGAAQAQAMAAMSQSLNTALSALLPMLAKAATGFDIPAQPAAPAPEPAPVAPSRPAPVVTPIPPIEIPGLTAGPAK